MCGRCGGLYSHILAVIYDSRMRRLCSGVDALRSFYISDDCKESAAMDEPQVDYRPVVDVSPEVLLGVGVFLIAVALTSTLGNSSFILVLLRSRKIRRDAHLILLLTMAFSDIGISVFGYPFTIVSCFSGKWVFSDAICQMYAFTCYTLSMISANILVVISIFRYIIICKPEIKHRLTPTVSAVCVLAAILYALIWTVPPFFGWSRYVLEPFGASCSFDWYDTSMGGITYAIATTIFCYLVHLGVMSFCYHNIRVRVSQLKLDTTPPTVPEIPAEDEIIPQDQIRCCFDAALLFDASDIQPRVYSKTGKIEIEVLKLNILMVSTFFIIWSPYAIVSLISVYYTGLSKFWYIFPTVFAKCACMCNPILYGLTNVSLRNELAKLLRQCFCPGKDQQSDHRSKILEGGRPIYDKEGIYLGKVNQGTCMCNGCTESRREVELLIRLQVQRSQNVEAVHPMTESCSIDQDDPQSSHVTEAV